MAKMNLQKLQAADAAGKDETKPTKVAKTAKPAKKTGGFIASADSGGLMQRLKKASKSEYADVMAEYTEIMPRDFISSGNYLFNSLLCADPYKGLPSGKIITLAGPPGCGKCHSFDTEIEIFVSEENLHYFK